MDKRLLMTAALAMALGATGAVAQEHGGRVGAAGGEMHASPGGHFGGGAHGGAWMHAQSGPVHGGGMGRMQPNHNAAQSMPSQRNAEITQPHRNMAQIQRERRIETTSQAGEERRGVVEQRRGVRTLNEREINGRGRVVGGAPTGRVPTTTGLGAASTHAAVKLTSEQRARLHDIFAGAHGPRLGSANFDLAVGHRIPRSVRFVPVPEAVYGIEPAWRGYDYFEVADEIVIFDPVTLEIVAVIDA
jgi:hypothetical protein